MPELKSPDFHNSAAEDHGMEQQLFDTLIEHGYAINSSDRANCSALVGETTHSIPCPPVIIQCFQLPALEYLNAKTETMQLLYLAEENPELMTYQGMERVAQVAQHYMTWKENLYAGVEGGLVLNKLSWNPTEINKMGGFVKPNDFVRHAHRLGMRFGVYTIYDSRETNGEDCDLTPDCGGNSKEAEMNYFLGMGVDSLFVENVAESREILLRFEQTLILEREWSEAVGNAGVASYECSSLRVLGAALLTVVVAWSEVT